MPDYTIVIHGTGSHHSESDDANVRSKDADVLVTQFVRQLESEGQRIHVASVTYGDIESETVGVITVPHPGMVLP